MSDDLESCRKMRLMYLQRAKSDPCKPVSGSNGPSGGRAREREEAWLSYQRSARQQMNAGAMGASGEVSSQQQGNATELRQGFCRANSDERFPLFSAKRTQVGRRAMSAGWTAE